MKCQDLRLQSGFRLHLLSRRILLCGIHASNTRRTQDMRSICGFYDDLRGALARFFFCVYRIPATPAQSEGKIDDSTSFSPLAEPEKLVSYPQTLEKTPSLHSTGRYSSEVSWKPEIPFGK